MIFIEKKLKKLKTENVHKHLKKSQNIFIIVWFKGTASIKFSEIFMYLQLFVFELQQNKEIATWEIDWISSIVKIWISNGHKNLIWLSYRHLFLDKDW